MIELKTKTTLSQTEQINKNLDSKIIQNNKSNFINSRNFEIVTRDADLAQKIITQLDFDRTTNYLADYAWAYHDQDTKEEQQDDGSTKTVPITPHWHIGMHFTHSRRLSDVAAHYGVKTEFVQKIRKLSAYLSYLTHSNAIGKHVYPISVVHTTLENWEEMAQSAVADKYINLARIQKNSYLNRIRTGEINLYDLKNAKFTDENQESRVMCALYQIAKKDCEDAFATWQFQNQSGKREVDRNVIFLCGKPGLGKSHYPITFCEQNGLNPDRDMCWSSNNDFVQNYIGQKVLLLDDYRPEILPFNTWLNVLDNSLNNYVKSRYHDRMITADFILITTTVPFNDWIDFFRKRYPKEDMYQFSRRVNYLYEFSVKNIDVKVNNGKNINKTKRIWDKYKTIKNPSYKYIKDNSKLKNPNFVI